MRENDDDDDDDDDDIAQKIMTSLCCDFSNII